MLPFTPANLRQYFHLQCSSAGSWSFVMSSTNGIYACGYQGSNLISSNVHYGVFTRCVQSSTTYPNMMFSYGNSNMIMINPYFQTTNSIYIISGSPKATSPIHHSH